MGLEEKAGKYVTTTAKGEMNLHVPSFSHSPNHTFTVRDEENEIPGHSRECSLRTVSPLLESGLMNRQPTSTDSADTLVAIQFAKRYELLRRENEGLRKTVIQQEQQIQHLKAVVASIQSDGYSSDSRHEKSSSTQSSSVPVLRVTPQKRSTTSSSTQTPTQTPRSARRSAGRRLEFSSEESESTPTASPAVQSRSNRFQNLPQSFTEPRRTSTPPVSSQEVSPQRTSQRRRPTILTRSLSTSASPSVATPISNRVHSAPSTPGPFFVMGTGRSEESDNVLATTTDSPGYYLKLHRSGFIQNLERRQMIIRTASAKRSKVEAVRKDTVKAVAEGKVRAADVEDILLFDPTQIQAFPKHEMRALTKRHMSSTKEYADRVNKQRKAVDDQANRILAKCYSLRTRSQLHGSIPDLSSLHI